MEETETSTLQMKQLRLRQEQLVKRSQLPSKLTGRHVQEGRPPGSKPRAAHPYWPERAH